VPTLEPALRYLERRPERTVGGELRVVGCVKLWGRVVDCAGGWRAEHAYPERLLVPRLRRRTWLHPGKARIARALEAYGVPIEVVDSLRWTASVP
jgi:hypothetical protein